MQWNFRWIDRPATKVLQLERDGEIRGSVSIDKDNPEDLALWNRIIEYALDIQNDDVETNTRIN